LLRPPKNRSVFRHRRRDRLHRLLEVAVQMAAKISDTALGALTEGESIFKSQRAIQCAERLARLNGVYLDVLSREILLLVLFGLCPIRDRLNLFGRRAALELFLSFETVPGTQAPGTVHCGLLFSALS